MNAEECIRTGTALVRRQSHASCKSVASVFGGGPGLVRCWSVGGLMWIAPSSDIKRLATLAIWLWMRLSAPCIDGAAPAQARRVPDVIAQTIGIEALVGLTLAEREAHMDRHSVG